MDYSLFFTLELIITVLFLLLSFKYSLSKQFSLKKNLLLWGVFGGIYNLYSFIFLYEVYPLLWFPTGFMQMVAITVAYLVISLVGGISYSLIGYVFYKFGSKKNLLLVLIPLSFIVAEILRSLLLSILHYGSGGYLGIDWIQGTLGSTLANTPLIELAYFGGAFTLTGALILITYSLTQINKNKFAIFFILIPFILLIIVHNFIPLTGTKENITILAVTTNFTDVGVENFHEEYKERYEKIKGKVMKNLDSNPDLILLPEGARFLSYSETSDLEKLKEKLNNKTKNALLIDGDTLPFGKTYRSYTLFYDIKSDTTLGRGKVYLTPFNEYIPYIFKVGMRALAGKDAYERHKEIQNYSYDKKIITFEAPFGKIGTLLCGEIHSYGAIYKLKKQNPNFVVIQSYLSVFNKGYLYQKIHLKHSKIVGASLRTPTIAVSNSGPNVLISPTGKIMQDFSHLKDIESQTINLEAGDNNSVNNKKN